MFDDLVEPLEHLPFDFEILEHGLDHQVHISQRFVLQGRRDQRQALIEARLGKRPLAQRALIIAADVDEAAVERLLRRLQERDRQSRIDEAHRNAATHRACADDPDPFDRAGGDRIGHAVDVGCGALGLEDVPQRRRFRGSHERHEQLAFALHSGLEGPRERSRQCLHTGRRRRVGAGESFHRIAGELQVGLGVGHLDLKVAHSLRAAPCRDQRACQIERGRAQITARYRIEERRATQLLGAHRIAGHDHVQRPLDSDHARQPLSAAGPGQQTELHLRKRDLRIYGRDAVVTRERKFKPPAHTHAMDGRDHGLGTVLDCAQYVVEVRGSE